MTPSIFSEENRKWWTLGAVSFGLFMIMLDNTVVNVALPSIQEDLGVDLSELQWIVTGYALTFAALMLIGGKLADAYGRRLIFVIGIVVFTLASLWCGLADSSEMLIVARIVQGVGRRADEPGDALDHRRHLPAAGSAGRRSGSGPASPRSRSRSARSSAASSPSTSAGTGSSSSTSRSASSAIAASYLLITESKDETHESLDLPGLATSALGLFALTYGLIEANTYGWTSARIVGSFVVAVVALDVVRRDRAAPARADARPDLFRSGTYTGANVAMLLVALAMFGVFFFVSLYMQNVLGYSAVQAGAAFLPMTRADHPGRADRREAVRHASARAG